MALFKNDSSMLKRQQDGLLSELHEIERSVYIAADADLSVFDRDEANDYGKAWGGASAGDIVGAPKVCARIARVVVLPRSYPSSDMHRRANGPLVSSWALVQG